MKLRFYMDFYPGQAVPHAYYASTNPGMKVQGCRRVAFDVTIPDHVMIDPPDVVAPEVGQPSVVSDWHDHG